MKTLTILLVVIGIILKESEAYCLIPDWIQDSYTVRNTNYIFFNAKEDMFFKLFTRERKDGEIITLTPDSISKSSFKKEFDVKILIHGYFAGSRSRFNSLVTNKYLDAGNFNVINVDWSVGSKHPFYPIARGRTSAAAAHVRDFIHSLLMNGFSKLSKIQIIGHSLGAHIAGLTGREIDPKYGKINAIFALDPAGPFYYGDKQDKLRFHKDDAAYTQAIHTNTRCSGYELPVAHADFYVNYGAKQPGCSSYIQSICSHSRAYEIFAESISSSNFKSSLCFGGYDEIKRKNCTIASGGPMGGLPWSYNLTGVFLVETNDKYPFSMG